MPSMQGNRKMATPLDLIRVGMVVVDASGEDVGDVTAVAKVGMADRSDVVADVLPPAVVAQLIQVGYIRVSRAMYPYDVYVPPEQIASVGDFGIRLSAREDELIAI